MTHTHRSSARWVSVFVTLLISWLGLTAAALGQGGSFGGGFGGGGQGGGGGGQAGFGGGQGGGNFGGGSFGGGSFGGGQGGGGNTFSGGLAVLTGGGFAGQTGSGGIFGTGTMFQAPGGTSRSGTFSSSQLGRTSGYSPLSTNMGQQNTGASAARSAAACWVVVPSAALSAAEVPGRRVQHQSRHEHGGRHFRWNVRRRFLRAAPT